MAADDLVECPGCKNMYRNLQRHKCKAKKAAKKGANNDDANGDANANGDADGNADADAFASAADDDEVVGHYVKLIKDSYPKEEEKDLARCMKATEITSRIVRTPKMWLGFLEANEIETSDLTGLLKTRLSGRVRRRHSASVMTV